MSDKKPNNKVLIVDDEDELRELISIYFSGEGFEVSEAKSGNEAIDLVKKNKYVAVISDIKMPNGDGVSLLKEIRRINPEIPIVVLVSGYAEVSPEEAVQLGALKMFSKPVDFTDLVRTVKARCSEF